MSDIGALGLRRLPDHGWRAGLSPLMRAGFGAWRRTKEWWTQALLWTVVINGSVAAALWGDAPEDLGVFGLCSVMTMFAAMAVAILMQEAIVGEKRSGAAAWVLSKPASREAFLLAKLVPNAVGSSPR
jgi:ABC-2 type transport system permease protein